MSELLVAVAVPVAVFRPYTYRVPPALHARAVPGARAVVPLGARRVVGLITDVDVPAPASGALRDLVALPDEAPALPAPLLALGDWMRRYYAVPPGMVLRAMLPNVLGSATVPDAPRKQVRVARIAQHLESLLDRDRRFARAPRQRVLYETLEALGGAAPTAMLLERAGVGSESLRALVKHGLVAIEHAVVSRDPFASRAQAAAPALVPTDAQRAAIGTITRLAPGAGALLRGVTGSGKTLVYIEVLREIVQRRGQDAIVLVPEIALTPQTVDRFRAAFGDAVAVLHSALSDGERHDAWRAIRDGEKRIVVGARSAIFAPLPRLGAIIVDEEHEATYKQGEAPRYHARDVARTRATLEGAILVLGSATPSLESWTAARQGTLTLVSLPDRAGGAMLPTVQVVDRRQFERLDRPGERPPPLQRAITPPLEAAIDARLRVREQTLLLLNRRGYANFLQCGECGHVSQCPNCAIALTLHRAPERLVCHYCGHREEPAPACPACRGPQLRQHGIGTQQLERLLVERWPEARIARMDLDTTGAKWAHAEILDRVGRGEVDILLGTQMIAKGLDFPNVTLVGVVDADTGINLPDFRASERCFQLLAQVAGRAGRGAKGGEVLIQTRVPTHHAVTCAVEHDFLRFAAEELQSRERPAYPPSVALANAIVSGTDETVVAEAARAVADWTRRLVAARLEGRAEIIGASPCPVERVQQRWRWHFLVKAHDPAVLGRLGRHLVQHGPLPRAAEVRLAWDRDPVTLL